MDIVIIGAGAASLSAARALLADADGGNVQAVNSVTIVEANSYVGGRIRSDDTFVEENRIDLGAEYVHGFKTRLTDVIDAKREEWEEVIGDTNQNLLEDIFIASHADGGPDERPTKDGKYAVYYLSEEHKIIPFDTDDEDFRQMTDSLSALVDLDLSSEDTPTGGVCVASKSLAAYLEERSCITERMTKLLLATYANTAGCTDLRKISLKHTVAFEKFWEENEEAGDARLHPRIGMAGVIDALREEIENDSRCCIHLNWTAKQIAWASHQTKVAVTNKGGEKILADKLIITAPPKVLISGQLAFDPPLPKWKREAFGMVGMDSAVKVVLKFRTRFWPEEIQTVISDAGCDIPELWFRDLLTSDEQNRYVHLAVGFLTSKAADELIHKVNKMVKTGSYDHVSLLENRRAEAAADIIKKQLSRIFSLHCTREGLEEAYESAILFDWSEVETIGGGYMYPKVGMNQRHFEDMARNLDHKLYFAGEATHTGACCTIQAAMETGMRAAKEILCKFSGQTIGIAILKSYLEHSFDEYNLPRDVNRAHLDSIHSTDKAK